MTLFASLKSLIFPTPTLTPGQSAAPVEMNTTADFAAILTMADDASSVAGPAVAPIGAPADVDLCDYAPLPTGEGEEAVAPSPRAILDGMQARSAIKVDAAKLPVVGNETPTEAVALKAGVVPAVGVKPDPAVDRIRLLDDDAPVETAAEAPVEVIVTGDKDPAVDPIRPLPVDATALKAGVAPAVGGKPDPAVDRIRLLDNDAPVEAVVTSGKDLAVDPIRPLPVEVAGDRGHWRSIDMNAVEPRANPVAVTPDVAIAEGSETQVVTDTADVALPEGIAPVAVAADPVETVDAIDAVEPKPETPVRAPLADAAQKPMMPAPVDKAAPVEDSVAEPVEPEKSDDATKDVAVAPEREVVADVAPVIVAPVTPPITQAPLPTADGEEDISIAGVAPAIGLAATKSIPALPLPMGAAHGEQPDAGARPAPIQADGAEPAGDIALPADPLPQPVDNALQAAKPQVDAVRAALTADAPEVIAPQATELRTGEPLPQPALAAKIVGETPTPVEIMAPVEKAAAVESVLPAEPIPPGEAEAKQAFAASNGPVAKPVSPAPIVDAAAPVALPEMIEGKIDPAAPLAPVRVDGRIQQTAPLSAAAAPELVAPAVVAQADKVVTAHPQAVTPAVVAPAPDKPVEQAEISEAAPVAARDPKAVAPRSEALALLQIVRDHMATRRAGQAAPAKPAVQAVRPTKISALGDVSPVSAEPAAVVATPAIVTPQPASVAPASQVDVAAAITGQVIDATASGQWIDGLAQDIARLAATGDQGRFSVNTAGLGLVDVDIRPDMSGGAAISLTVASEAAELALRQDSEQLRTEPALSHLRISEVRVDRIAERVAPAQDMARADQDAQQRGGSSSQGQAQAGLGQSGQGQHQQHRSTAQENLGLAHKAAAEQAVIRRGQADDATLARARRAASGERYA